MAAVISYKKLFKLLIDRNLLKKDLCRMANISTTSVTKLSRGEHVNTEILEKVCEALKCDISDICEISFSNKSEDESNE